MKLIVLENIRLGYGNNIVIDGLSFDIEERDFICVVGPNGSGKTTLIRGILGLLPLKAGRIKFGNLKNQIGYMPQETAVESTFPASVFEIVLSGSLNNHHNFYCAETKERAKDILKLLGMVEMKDKGFSQLSGGQRQKVLLARALMATQKILILDEPSNNLDQKSKQELYKTLRKLNTERGIAIVMVTHDLDHTNLIGDKILSLDDRDYFFGTTEEYVKKVHHE